MKETLNKTRRYPFSPDELFLIFNEEALLIFKDQREADLIASDVLSEFIKIYGDSINMEKSSTLN